MIDNRKYGFDPLVRPTTRILILGTLPGGESLLRNQYYADFDNLFWDIIYRILDPDLDCDFIVQEEACYQEKCDFILSKGIGIWDVLESAERENSSDNKIKNEVYNDFPTFLINYNKINKLIFNGGKAYTFFRRKYRNILNQLDYYQLNSTSPQNSTNSFYILKEWRKVINNAT